MRVRLGLLAAGVLAIVSFGSTLSAHAADSCAPGTTNERPGTIPVILQQPIPLIGDAYLYTTIVDRGPLYPKHRGAAGLSTDAGYVELFGGAPTKDGHVHGDVYDSGVNFDIAIGHRSTDDTPATVTRLCVGGTQVIGDEYGYTAPE